jgi:hypothetical protein
LGTTPPAETDINSTANATLSSSVFGGTSLPDESVIGSPLKKHRASIVDIENGAMQRTLESMSGGGIGAIMQAANAEAKAAQSVDTSLSTPALNNNIDEEEL